MPFEGKVVDVELNPRDSILTNARTLAGVGGGATACSAPLAELNRRKARGDLVIYVSDSESWIDSETGSWRAGQATETLKQWAVFKKRNPRAKNR